jgi:cell division septum initiation protein DivIVA
MEENIKEILKYLKSIAKSLETIAKVENEENKREIAEMKQELKYKEKEKQEAIDDANEIIAILESENLEISQQAKDKITSSLQD